MLVPSISRCYSIVTAADDVQNLSSGQKFMIGLLVNSLIGHGGLEQALKRAIESETTKLEDVKVAESCISTCVSCDFNRRLL